MSARYSVLCRVVCVILCASLSYFAPCGVAAWAASAHTAPHTGLEGGSRNSYGPDGEGKRDKRTMMSMPNDAYGNPIVPVEEEATPRVRPRPGGDVTPPQAQALPPMPQRDAGWKFR